MSNAERALGQYPTKHLDNQHYGGVRAEVGGDAFRRSCVEDIKEWGYVDHENFFERYLGGEDFKYDKLVAMGYDHFSARNLDGYINNRHVGMYTHALGWE